MDQIITFLFALTPLQLAVGCAVTAATIAMVMSSRLALFMLYFQYICVAFLLNSVLPSNLGTIQMVVGTVACLIFYLTVRRVEATLDAIPDGRSWWLQNREVFPMGRPFRFLALIFITLVLLGLPERFIAIYDILPRGVIVPAFWMLAMGLLTIILTRDPIKTGMGLLVFQNGFVLMYMPIAEILTIYGLMGISSIMVALVASYLAIARHLPMIEARQVQVQVSPPAPPEPSVPTLPQLEEGQLLDEDKLLTMDRVQR